MGLPKRLEDTLFFASDYTEDYEGFGDEYFLTKKDLSWMKNRDFV